MYAATDRFQEATRNSNKFAIRGEIRVNGVLAASGFGITGGTLTSNNFADVRNTCTVEIAGVPESFLPTGVSRAPYDIYGNELHISAGINYGDSEELVPQGVFRITDAYVSYKNNDAVLNLKGVDRSDTVNFQQRTPLVTPVNTGLIDAIKRIIERKLPGTEVVNFSVENDPIGTTHLLDEQAYPWRDGVQKFAEAAGAEVFFDRLGRAVIKDLVDYSSRPVSWVFEEGPDCVFDVLEQDFTDLNKKNSVVATSSGTGSQPITAYAVDDNIISPTYYNGPFRERPVWVTSPLIETFAQAQRLADARLFEELGRTEEANITALPNYALDVGDIIHLKRGHVDGLYAVTSFTLPWSYRGKMSLKCKAVR